MVRVRVEGRVKMGFVVGVGFSVGRVRVRAKGQR